MKLILRVLSTVLLGTVAIAQAQLPVTTPKVDAKANAILQDNEKAMFALKSYSAECWTTTRLDDGKMQFKMATLIAAKPNRIRYDAWEMEKDANDTLSKKQETPTDTTACDGKTVYRQDGKVCTSSAEIDPDKLRTSLEPWMGFHSTGHSLHSYFARQEVTPENLRYMGQETVDGTPCDVVTFKYNRSMKGTANGKETEIRWEDAGQVYIGPDKLVRRQVTNTVTQLFYEGAHTRTMRNSKELVIRSIRTNFPAPSAAIFTYTLPKGITLQVEKPRPRLLVKGTVAPDFTAQDRTGKPVRLSDFRGKVVVIDFWATWCGPCIASMPGTNKVAKAYKDKGVVVLAINVWDGIDSFKEWLPKNTQHDSMLFLIDPNGNKDDVAQFLYGVSGIPTQFVIDARGVIRASFVGSGSEEALEKAILAAQK